MLSDKGYTSEDCQKGSSPVVPTTLSIPSLSARLATWSSRDSETSILGSNAKSDISSCIRSKTSLPEKLEAFSTQVSPDNSSTFDPMVDWLICNQDKQRNEMH
nr:hypothetical protein Iba_chr11aCG3660 [Ipomoea batatas]